MNRNIQKKHFLKLTPTEVFTFFSYRLNAQNFLNGLGGNFSDKYDCSGTDSLGNLYVAKGLNGSDTVFFRKWNSSANSRSVGNYLKGYDVNSYKISSCDFLNDKLFYRGIDFTACLTLIMEHILELKAKYTSAWIKGLYLIMYGENIKILIEYNA